MSSNLFWHEGLANFKIERKDEEKTRKKPLVWKHDCLTTFLYYPQESTPP